MTDIRALGIDVGSTTVKIVGVDAAGDIERHRINSASQRGGNRLETDWFRFAQPDSSSFHIVELSF